MLLYLMAQKLFMQQIIELEKNVIASSISGIFYFVKQKS